MEILDGQVVPEAPAPAAPAPTPRKQSSGAAIRQMREEEAVDIRSVIDSMGLTNVPIRINVIRESPKSWKGKPCTGKMGTYDESITEDRIREEHGGGTYRLMFQRPRNDGSQGYQIVTQRTIEIPGPPNLSALGFEQDADAGTSIAQQAMDAMKSSTRDAQVRAERMERERMEQFKQQALSNNNGFDPRLIEVMNQPLMAQLAALQSEKASLDQKITTLLSQKPDNSFQEKMLDKMTDESNRRLEVLREQHASEMRVVRENQHSDLARVHDSYKDQIKSMERLHERELESLKIAYEGRIETLKTSYDMRVDGLRGDVTRAERDLGKVEAEAGALRAKKEKSIGEQIREITDIKDMVQEFGGGGGEDKKDVWEKVFDNPIVAGIGARIMGGAPPVEQQQAQQQAQQDPRAQYQEALIAASQKVPPNTRFKMQGDTRIWFKTADNRLLPVRPKRPQQPAQPKAPAAPDIGVSAEELRMAVAFIEGALAAGTTPAEFAASAATMVPAGILRVINEHGTDWLIDEVIKPSDSSPLKSQRGRSFLREVAQELAKTS